MTDDQVARLAKFLTEIYAEAGKALIPTKAYERAGQIIREMDQDLEDWGCGTCHTCINKEIQRQEDAGDPMAWLKGQFMVLCVDCGNKRCPKANNHENACTGSNEPGQPGSAYPATKILTEKEAADLKAKMAARRKELGLQ